MGIMTVTATATRTKYFKLAEQVGAEIRRGRLGPGQAVPSIRQLMVDKKVSKATVLKGLSLLERDGLVRRHPQRGYFVNHPGFDGRARAARPAVAQIAFVTPALSGDTQPLTRGIAAALERADAEDDNETVHTLATFSSHGDLERYQQLIERVVDLRPAGLILEAVRPEVCPIDARPLVDAGVPIVLLGHGVDGLACDRVCEGKAAAARQLVRHVREQGYRRPAVIACGPEELKPSDAWSDSLSWEVVRELRASGVACGEGCLFTLPGRRGYGSHPNPYAEAEELVAARLAAGDEFDVIICDHDYPAVGAVRAVLASGRQLREDVAVISGGRNAVEGAGVPKLTTVDHHRGLEGRLAAERLLGRMADGPSPAAGRHPEVHHLSATLIVGQTG